MNMKSFLSDRSRLIRLASTLFCAIGVVALSFTLSPLRAESTGLDYICSATCSTYCSGGTKECFEVSCCKTDTGGCLVGDPTIIKVECTDNFGMNG